MGLLDDIGGVLSSPAVAELLPTAMGAAGGLLTSPRLAGGRGALGNALLGGAQGLEAGTRNAAEQQDVALRTKQTQIENQYRTVLMNQATKAQQDQDNSLPTLQRMLQSQLKSPFGQQFFGDTIKPEDVKNLDYNSLVKELDALDKGQTEFIKNGGKTTIKDSVSIADDGKPHTFRDVLDVHGNTVSRRDLGEHYERPITTNVFNEPAGTDPFAALRAEPYGSYLPPAGTPMKKGQVAEEIDKARAAYRTDQQRATTEADKKTAASKKDDPAVKAVRDQYNKQAKENTDVNKTWVTKYIDGLPHPDLPKTWEEYAASPAGKRAITAQRQLIGETAANAPPPPPGFE